MSKFVDKISIESGKLNCANKSFLQLGKIVQTDLADSLRFHGDLCQSLFCS